jgi:hypothetical protein
VLTGGPGQDWFWGKLSENFTDLQPGEQVN